MKLLLKEKLLIQGLFFKERMFRVIEGLTLEDSSKLFSLRQMKLEYYNLIKHPI